MFCLFHRIPLPSFDATLNGVNELDLKMQEIRQVELANLVEEAGVLREQATDINEAMEVIDGYLRRIKDLCIEVRFFNYLINKCLLFLLSH